MVISPQRSQSRFANSRILVRDHGGDAGESFCWFTCPNAETLQQARQFIQGTLPCLSHLGLKTVFEEELEDSAICVDFGKCLDDLRNTNPDRLPGIAQLPKA